MHSIAKVLLLLIMHNYFIMKHLFLIFNKSSNAFLSLSLSFSFLWLLQISLVIKQIVICDKTLKSLRNKTDRHSHLDLKEYFSLTIFSFKSLIYVKGNQHVVCLVLFIDKFNYYYINVIIAQ